MKNAIQNCGASDTHFFEVLEDRRVLAVAVWDGGPTGNGVNWQDAANWVGDVLPAAADGAQLAGATIATDIGGTAANQYGRITATGAVALNGTLIATLVNGYAPVVFARFDVVTGSSVSGSFSSLKAPEPGDPIDLCAVIGMVDHRRSPA